MSGTPEGARCTHRNAGITLGKTENARITQRNPNPCRKYANPDKESNPAKEHNRVPSKTEQERRSLLDGHSSRQHVELARTLLPQQAVRLRPGAPLDLAGQDTPTKSRTTARRPPPTEPDQHNAEKRQPLGNFTPPPRRPGRRARTRSSGLSNSAWPERWNQENQ